MAMNGNATNTTSAGSTKYRVGLAHRLDVIEAATSRIEELLVELVAERAEAASRASKQEGNAELNPLEKEYAQLRRQRVALRQSIQRLILENTYNSDELLEICRNELRFTERRYAEVHALLGRPYGRRPVRMDAPAPRSTPAGTTVVKRLDLSLSIKSVSDELRELRGTATTSSIDLVGDRVLPDGATYKLPMPLLLSHNHNEPVGEVVSATPTSNGINIVARIATVTEPGHVKDLTDRAWHMVKYRLIRGLSIGFKGIDREPMPDGGILWKTWRWLETSIVALPAQPEAAITGTRQVA
jgi:hypothetical protein